MFADKRQQNHTDIVLDYLYITFCSTFKGLRTMLKRDLDPSENISQAIELFLDVLEHREVTEDFNTK